jgi:hypothetical protein
MIKMVEELEAVRIDWEKQQSHPNNDFAQFTMVCQLRPDVESPCVIVIAPSGQSQTLLAGRLEKTQFAPPIGYLNPPKIPARIMTVLHQGVLGHMDDEVAVKSVEYLWSLLSTGVGDAIEYHYLSEDSPLLKALQLHRPGWFCEKRLRWSVHWEMNLPTEGAYIEHKVRAKHRTGIRKKERELESAFPGKVFWRWMSQFDDISGLSERLEEVAARAYQRGLGTGFTDNEEYRRRFALFASRGQLRVQLLEINGRVRAFWFGYLYRDVFHLSETGYDPDLSRYKVGTLSIIRLSDELAREGIRKVDFGIGDAHYKQRFGDWSRAGGDRLAVCSDRDKFGRNMIQRIGLLDRLKAGWLLRLAPRKSSADPE